MHRTGVLILAWLSLTLGCVGNSDDDLDRGAEVTFVTPETGETASADGVPIAYTVEGQGEPALLFIHGWCCDRGYWLWQSEPFLAGHKVVMLDLAGHGRSGTGRSDWTIDAFGADVQAVVRALDLHRVILIGHSMGAPVALAAARRMPEQVVGVIAIDALHDAEASRRDQSGLRALLRSYQKDFAGTCDRYVRSTFPEGADGELVDGVAADMCSCPEQIGLPILERFIDYDLGAAMRAVRVPIRCLNSNLIPTRVELNRTYAPDYDAVILEGVGHFPMLERPIDFNEALAKLISGLTGHAPPRRD